MYAYSDARDSAPESEATSRRTSVSGTRQRLTASGKPSAGHDGEYTNHSGHIYNIIQVVTDTFVQCPFNPFDADMLA